MVLCLALLAACRGDAPAAAQQLDQVELEALVDTLMPQVAEAAGLTFKSRPAVAVRSKEQVRTFLLAKLAKELPPERVEGLVAAYRLLGLLPDSLDLSTLFVDLYTEQIAGFYEPDSSMLYAVGGTDRLQLKGIIAHELTHALQHQYVALDSILDDRSDADRLAAAQAVLEGQATVVMLVVLAPDREILSDDGVWELLRSQLTGPTAGLEVFNAAPLVIRTGLVFPYLEGASFMRWWINNRGREQPYGALMPTSTEQILHPERYQRGDGPVALVFDGDSTDVMHEDTFGEYEMDVLRSGLAGIQSVATDLALGWGGDRLRVYRTPGGPALVWYSVWDEPRQATTFRERVIGGLPKVAREGYRLLISEVPVGFRSGVQVVIAPEGWSRWSDLPAVTAR
jgi:hypothetical protein